MGLDFECFYHLLFQRWVWATFEGSLEETSILISSRLEMHIFHLVQWPVTKYINCSCSVWSISALNWNRYDVNLFISAICLDVYSDLYILLHCEFEAFLCKDYWLTFGLLSCIAHHLRTDVLCLHWTWAQRIWIVALCSILCMCHHVRGGSRVPRLQYLVHINHLDLILVLS